MKLASLARFFESRLKEPMPGKSAHDLMLPTLVNGSNIRFKHEKKPRQGGVLILFYEEEGIVRFPLIERPEYDGIHSGQIALPGGRKEETDSSLIRTALREAEEEIGVDDKEIEVLGGLSPFFVGASNHDILPVIGITQRVPIFRPDPREVKEIITPATIDLLDANKRKKKDMVVRNGHVLSSPYFDLEGKVVWGATAMMLSELSFLLSEFEVS